MSGLSTTPPPTRIPPTWRELHPGEDPRIEALQFARFRDAAGWEKMRVFRGLVRASRQLAMAGLRQRHPDASDAEVAFLLAEMLLGRELASRVWERRAASR